MCVNDLTAFGAIDYLRESGRRVPDDVSVTGYDDISLARYSSPPLTTLHIPWYEMAEAATASLISALDIERTALIQKTFPVELVMRETTAPARVRSDLVESHRSGRSMKGGT
jgi:DNA-binding LacI/PurR family transcriptional regulator